MCLCHFMSDLVRVLGSRGERVPVWPFAAAMCRGVLPLRGSTARVRRVGVARERVLAVEERVVVREWVSPVRAR